MSASLSSYQNGLSYFQNGIIHHTPAVDRSKNKAQESELSRLLNSSSHEDNRESAIDHNSCCSSIRRFWKTKRATSFLESGKRSHKHFKFEEAVKLYTESLKIFLELKCDKVKIGEIYYLIGRVYKDQNKSNDAFTVFRQSLELFERSIPNSMNVADTCSEIGSLYENQKRLEHALEQYDVSARIYDNLLLDNPSRCPFTSYPDTRSAIYVYCKIGENQKKIGHIDKALAFFQKSAGLLKHYPYTLILSDVFYSIAKIYQSQNKIDDAIDYYEKSQYIFQALVPVKRLGQTTHSSHNPGINPLTEQILSQHRANTAEPTASWLIDVTRTWNLQIASRLFKAGCALSNNGLQEDALKKYQESLAIFERYAPFSLDIAAICNNIGLVYQSQKKFPEALEFFHKTLLLQQRLIPISYHIANTHMNIGSVYENQGRIRDFFSEKDKAERIKARCNEYGSCR